MPIQLHLLITDSLNTNEGCATISDDARRSIVLHRWNQYLEQNHIRYAKRYLVYYGDSSSTQSAIIVPKPNDPNIYYVFTVDNAIDGSNFGLNYSEVNITH